MRRIRGPAIDSRLAWVDSTLGEVWAPLALGEDAAVYLTSRDTKLHTIDSNGVAKRTYTSEDEIVFSPAVEHVTGIERNWLCSGGEVVVLDDEGQLVNSIYQRPGALCPSDGQDQGCLAVKGATVWQRTT